MENHTIKKPSISKVVVPFPQTSYFSQLICDYLQEKPELKELYKYPPTIGAIRDVARDKARASIDRELLVEILQQQYAPIHTSDVVRTNIDKLQDKSTFTITTAHQPCIFTGPLYVIYKICSVISMCRKLSERYADLHFVPVFWIGGEDHDFEEINHIRLFKDTLSWENELQGPVGRMSLAGIAPLIDDIEQQISRMEHGPALVQMLRSAYDENQTLSAATAAFLNDLFRDYGLVIIDQDHASFKNVFKEVIKDELLHQFAVPAIQPAMDYLEEHYRIQAHPREINFFYMLDGMRERIVRNPTNDYEVLNSDIRFREQELIQEIEQFPERFSPNVILRPLYQQMILPNLAYIGGGGELSYWFQLKGVFESKKVNFPMLLLRDSALLTDSRLNGKLEKLGLRVEDLFEETEALITAYVKGILVQEPEFTDEKTRLSEMFHSIQAKAKEIDPTLEKSVAAELQKGINSLENLEQKFIRAEKRRHEISVNQIRNIKSKLFPENALQERIENFLPYYAKYGPGLIEVFLDHFDPFEKQFKILTLD